MRSAAQVRGFWLGVLVVLPASLTGCAAGFGPNKLLPRVEVVGSQTVPEIGAGQGVAIHDGHIYLYGDADTGVIREYRLIRDPAPQLSWTGREVRLTRDGQDLIPHPTGLAIHAGLPTFLGNTVDRHGTIYSLDWPCMWRDGNLDHAVLASIDDDCATNGTRPEYVQRAGRWVIATADYGQEHNELRFYDPRGLARARQTSAAGVLIGRQPCDRWVQGLCWLGKPHLLVLIQNQTEGRGWRLTCLSSIEPASAPCGRQCQDFDVRGELEGFCAVDEEWCILLRNGRRENVHFGRLHWEPAGGGGPLTGS